jgi:hypothetical protein
MPWVYIDRTVGGSVTDDDANEIGVLHGIEIEQTRDVRFQKLLPMKFVSEPKALAMMPTEMGVATGIMKLEILVTDMYGLRKFMDGARA